MHQKVVKVVSHYTASLRKTHTNGRLSTPLIYTLTCQISFSMNIFKRTSQKSLLYRTGCLDVFLNFACKIKAHLSKTIRIFSVAPNGLGGDDFPVFRKLYICAKCSSSLSKIIRIFSMSTNCDGVHLYIINPSTHRHTLFL